MVAADPFLHDAQISIGVTQKDPPQSRIVLINNLGLYEGRAVAPTVSQNLLTQMNTDNVPASFTLGFRQAGQKHDLHGTKGLSGNTERYHFSGMARRRPEFERPRAELGGRRTHRRFADVPTQTYSLRAPAFDGIIAVQFSSDPRLDGVPFAAFSAILIEQITLVPME